MAGLFEKNIRLIMQRKNVLMILMLLSVFLAYTQEGTFIVSYLPAVATIMIIGTMSYDELDNGYRFLLTLPVTTRIYVIEKYIFCVAGIFMSWILAVVLYFFMGVLHGNKINIVSDIPMLVRFFIAIEALVFIILPMQIKFGIEKSRVVILIVCGAIIAGIIRISKVIDIAGIINKIRWIDQLNIAVLVSGEIFIVFGIGIISCFTGCKIMENREF